MYINLEIDDAKYLALSDEEKKGVQEELSKQFDKAVKEGKPVMIKDKDGNTLVHGKDILRQKSKVVEVYQEKERKLPAQEQLDRKLATALVIEETNRWNTPEEMVKKERERASDDLYKGKSNEVREKLKFNFNKFSEFSKNKGGVNDMQGLINTLNDDVQGRFSDKVEALTPKTLSPDYVEFMRAREDIMANPLAKKDLDSLPREAKTQMLKNITGDIVEIAIQTVPVQNKYAPSQLEKEDQAKAVLNALVEMTKIMEQENKQLQMDILNHGMLNVPPEFKVINPDLQNGATVLTKKQELDVQKIEKQKETKGTAKEANMEKVKELLAKANEQTKTVQTEKQPTTIQSKTQGYGGMER